MKLSLDILHNTALNIHIIGATAVEGSAIARLLHSLGAKKVTLHDFCERSEFNKRFLAFHNGVAERVELLQQMKQLPYLIHFKDTYLQDIARADLLFVPQHWYGYEFNFPVLAEVIQQKKIEVSSFIDLALQLFPGVTIGITGTHGKTTVNRLITHIINTTGKKVFTAGNDRHSTQFLSTLTQAKQVSADDYLVLEISNRQLKLPLEKSPHIAIITNIYPNHLDEHLDLADYRSTKMSIAKKQLASDILIAGANDEVLRAWVKDRQGKVIEAEQVTQFKTKFLLPNTLQGEHNAVNATIAYVCLQACGVSDELFSQGLRSFPGVEKRQEVVFENDMVQVINNSIATTPIATLAALNTFKDKPLFIILGGDDKNIPAESWNQLLKAIKASNCQVALLPGSIRQKIDDQHWLHLDSIEQAFEAAGVFVAQQKSPTTVLVSPSGEAFYTMYLVGKSLTKLAKDYFSSSTTLKRG